ncbi:unnamed protein product [Symbiodinium natans]|uniref:Uncharacterized protein n=1 Tax=Symbiodinium natans TaxID=878477 RepID=A0A812KJT4_9DINO|nr:unnamed protein product [Symbiodinium natans]
MALASWAWAWICAAIHVTKRHPTAYLREGLLRRPWVGNAYRQRRLAFDLAAEAFDNMLISLVTFAMESKQSSNCCQSLAGTLFTVPGGLRRSESTVEPREGSGHEIGTLTLSSVKRQGGTGAKEVSETVIDLKHDSTVDGRLSLRIAHLTRWGVCKWERRSLGTLRLIT